MSRLSPVALLLLGAFMVPVFVELPIVLEMVGLHVSIGASLAAGVVAFAVLLLWSEFSDPGGNSAGS